MIRRVNSLAVTSVAGFNSSAPAETEYKAGSGLEADGKLAASESTNRRAANVRHRRTDIALGVLARPCSDPAEAAHGHHRRVPSWKQR